MANTTDIIDLKQTASESDNKFSEDFYNLTVDEIDKTFQTELGLHPDSLVPLRSNEKVSFAVPLTHRELVTEALGNTENGECEQAMLLLLLTNHREPLPDYVAERTIAYSNPNKNTRLDTTILFGECSKSQKWTCLYSLPWIIKNHPVWDRMVFTLSSNNEGGMKIDMKRYSNKVSISEKPLLFSASSEFPIPYPFNRCEYVQASDSFWFRRVTISELQMGAMFSSMGISEMFSDLKETAHNLKEATNPESIKKSFMEMISKISPLLHSFVVRTVVLCNYTTALMSIFVSRSYLKYLVFGVAFYGMLRFSTVSDVLTEVSQELLNMVMYNTKYEVTNMIKTDIALMDMGHPPIHFKEEQIRRKYTPKPTPTESPSDFEDISMSSLQGGEEESAMMQLYEAVIDSYQKILSKMYDIPKFKIKDIIFGIIHFERLKSGLSAIFEMLFNAVNAVSKYVVGKEVLNGTHLVSMFSTDDIYSFLKEFDQLVEDINTGVLVPDFYTYLRVKEMVETCEGMLLVKAPLGVVNVLNNKLRSMQIVLDKLVLCSPGFANTRPEPAPCFLIGGPDTKKSTMLTYIATALDPNGKPYNRVPAQQYWDGYLNQKVCVFEEFGMMAESAGDPESEYGTVIKAINTALFPLHMARVEDKGKYHFTSEYCLYSSNDKQLKSNVIKEPGAVRRRFKDYIFAVSPKEQYCVDYSCDITERKLDMNKITIIKQTDTGEIASITPDLFEFHGLSVEGNQREPTGEVLSFDELVDKIRKRRAMNVERHAANSNSIREYLDKKPSIEDSEIDDVFREFGPSQKAKSDEDVIIKIKEPSKTNKIKAEKCINNIDYVKQTLKNFATDVLNIDQVDYLANVWDVSSDDEMKDHFKNKTLYGFLYHYRNAGFVTYSGNILNEELRDVVSNSKYTQCKNYLTYGVPIIACILGVYKMYQLYTDTPTSEIVSDLQSPGTVLKPKPGPKRSIAEILNRDSLSSAQMGAIKDPAGTTFVDVRFSKNCYVMLRNGVRLGTILFIKDTFALTSAHFAHSFQRDLNNPNSDLSIDSILDFYRCSGKSPAHYRMTIGQYLGGIMKDEVMMERDQYIIKFPGQFNTHSDIRDMFKYAIEFKNDYECVRRIVYDVEGSVITKQENFSRAMIVTNHAIKYYTDIVDISHIYSVNMVGALGQCGSIYTEVNSSVQKKKIIGIHVSGQGDRSYFFPVTRNDLDAVINQEFCEDEELSLSTSQMGSDDFNNKFTFYRHVKAIARPFKSTFQKSKIYGLIQEPITFPAPLSPFGKNKIDPSIVSLNKYNDKQPFFVDETVLQMCIESEIDWYRSSSKKRVDARILTNPESVLGIEGDEDFGPMSRSTSPGYPYIFERKLPGRCDWFGKEEQFDLSTPKCQELFDNMSTDEHKMSKGHRVSYIFTDNLKDECIKLSKVLAGNTRSFSGSNLRYQTLVRKYFGSFICWFHKNRFSNGCTIGINCYSLDYDHMAKLLHSKNKYVNAGDFKSFDSSQIKQILESLLCIVESFYSESSEDERTIRRMLFMEVYNSTHIYKTNVYRWDCSLPSGHPLTAILNSMYNRVAHKLCFYDLHHEKNILTFYEFNSKVCLLTQGDDSVMTSEPEIHSWYNEYTLGPSMSKLGLTYTPENKEVRDESLGYCSRLITEVTFLKRYWRYDSDWRVYVGSLKLADLLDQTNWTRDYDSDTIFMDKINSVLRELSLHSVEVFDKYVPLILEKVEDYYPEYPVLTTNRIALQTQVFNSVLQPLGGSILQMNNTMINTPNKISYVDYHSQLLGDNNNDVKEVSFLQMGETNNMNDTELVDDSVTQVVVPPETDRLKHLDSDVSDSNNTSIVRFLQKPVRITSGTLTSTDTRSVFSVYEWYHPLTSSSMYSDKIAGVQGFKADLVITLQVNANPFQQGKYILWYCSYGGACANKNAWFKMHTFSIVQILQLPHVIIDVNTETSVQLVVPWRSSYSNYYINSSFDTNPGCFSIYPYSPLDSTVGSTDASFTLWANYDNILLSTVGSLQMGKSKKVSGRDILTQEQEEPDRTISRTLAVVSKATGTMASIPLLSSVAGPLTWATDAASKIAYALGYSKPNITSAPMRIVRNSFPYLAVSDAPSAEEPLSLTAGNHVGFFPESFGTKVDEMSIQFLKTIPNYVGSYEWDTINVVGDSIASFSVCPVLSKFSQSDGAVSVTSIGPLTFLSKCFNYWRGSLIFKFSFVKTGFHSGRLVFAFQPYDVTLSSPVASTLTTTDFMLRTIVDIREKSEVEITIPFLHSAPWQQCRYDNGEIGALRVYVLDPLVAPDSVPSTITMKVTITGGPDLAFAAPKNIEYVPVVPSAVQMGIVPRTISQCQMNSSASPGQIDLKSTTIGGIVPNRPFYIAEELCQGETVPSIRMLLKRRGYLQSGASLATVAELYIIAPFANYWYTSNGTTIAGSANNVTRDFYSMFSSIYSMSRGGIRLRIMSQPSSSANVYISLDHVDSNAGNVSNVWTLSSTTTESDLILKSGNQGQAFSNAAATTIPGVFVPGHTRTVNRPNASQFMTSSTSLSYSKGETAPAQVYFYYNAASGTNSFMHRAGADDCGFGDFVSIPPHYIDT
jgi:hypothetical protein